MLGFKSHSRVEEIESILAQERAALLGARIEILTRLSHKKQRALRTLEEGRLSPDQLARVLQKSKENQLLYKAVLDGLRAVQDRISAVRNTQNRFAVYGADGTERKTTTSNMGRDLRV